MHSAPHFSQPLPFQPPAQGFLTTTVEVTSINYQSYHEAPQHSQLPSTPNYQKRPTIKMTVSSDSHPPFAHELLIAQLAVQRAALVTKRVLATINAAKSPPIPQPPSDSDIDIDIDTPSLDFDTCASPIIYTTPVSETPPATFHFTPPPLPKENSIGQYLHPSSSPGSPTRHPHPSNDNNNNRTRPDHPPRRLSLAKPDTSPVTIADLAAQALLVSAVHTAFPHDLVLGEEDASALRADPDLAAQVWELVATTRLEDDACEALLGRPSGVEEMMALIELGAGGEAARGGGGAGGRRVWCMDPIDGTSAYMQGGQYAISLALLEGGREVVGVLGCPNWRFEGEVPVGGWRVQEHGLDEEGMGLLLSAVRGQGASVRPMGRGALCEGTRVERGRGKAVDMRDLHFVDSEKSPATLTEKVREMAEIFGATDPGTNLYSSHMRYAAMALGGRECVQLRWPKPGKGAWSCWDHAGSQLIYTESGAGKVTDLSGNPIDFTTGNKLSNSWGLITADESIHGEILALTNHMRAMEA
ncbi:hypothetical protein F5144DRAFT_582551 [Chaetomium tenue]|uniref:Uncharacterized protein n=1 Tax=Chaetomium tenue TaxID=1854479 RepID=A0ACB7P0U5_9PEZI|nr:hypothetical protein F5144DRAFT_582551 [Chaetomium globosum]